MLSAELRKSVTDLTRRRARTAFTVATLALAVASISFLAIPSVIDASMQDEVRAESLADATVTMRPLRLTDAQLTELAALPNVAGIEPGIRVNGRVLVGERRAPALVIGVRDFARQSVDIVRLASGAYPGPREVLTDVQNANVGVYDGRPGDRARVVGAGGLRITGEARNIPGGEEVQDEHVIVLYATTDTIAALGGARGYDRLAIRLRDPSRGAETVESVRRYLATVPGFTGFSGLPELRAPGDWPGKADTEAFAEFLGVITLLALLSALVLVSNTMTTLIAEQTGEIGIMRAIGARRRQVGLVYLRTAVLIGALGTVAGVILGIVVAWALARFFGSTYWAIDVALTVDVPVVLASIVLGVLVPVLAALPAIRRGVRTDLLLALESTGSAVGGRSASDSVLRGATFLPRTMQIGLRSLGRRRRRSIATVVIVALAVANLARGARAGGGGDRELALVVGEPSRGSAPLDDRPRAVRREGAPHDRDDARRRAGTAGSDQRCRPLGQRGLPVGGAARAAPALPALGRAVVQRSRGAGTGARRRARAQPRGGRGRRRRRRGHAHDGRGAAPAADHRAGHATSRRTGRCSTFR